MYGRRNCAILLRRDAWPSSNLHDAGRPSAPRQTSGAPGTPAGNIRPGSPLEGTRRLKMAGPKRPPIAKIVRFDQAGIQAIEDWRARQQPVSSASEATFWGSAVMLPPPAHAFVHIHRELSTSNSVSQALTAARRQAAPVRMPALLQFAPRIPSARMWRTMFKVGFRKSLKRTSAPGTRL